MSKPIYRAYAKPEDGEQECIYRGDSLLKAQHAAVQFCANCGPDDDASICREDDGTETTIWSTQSHDWLALRGELRASEDEDDD